MTRNPSAKLRIVSLAPSATSILWAIGAQRHVVGVTKWCADVAPVGGLPKLGDCWRMEELEKLTALKPTLVIGSVPFKGETVERILQEPTNFLALNPRSLENVYEDIRLLGRVTQRMQPAEQTVRKMNRHFAAIQKQSSKLKQRPRV